jgi:hypothetical protein
MRYARSRGQGAKSGLAMQSAGRAERVFGDEPLTRLWSRLSASDISIRSGEPPRKLTGTRGNNEAAQKSARHAIPAPRLHRIFTPDDEERDEPADRSDTR